MSTHWVSKGIGEIGITGVVAAIANAVYHATGKRVRDLPITLDKGDVARHRNRHWKCLGDPLLPKGEG